MKIAFTLLLIICTVFSCGCTTVSPAGTTHVPSTTAVPQEVTASDYLPEISETDFGS